MYILDNLSFDDLPTEILNPTLLDTLLSAYKEELQTAGGEQIETDYDIGISSLSIMLNDVQKITLSEIEQLYTENLSFALQFGFSRGLYAQLKPNHTEYTSFEILVENQLLTEPQIRHYPYYHQRLCTIQQKSNLLENQLNDILREHFISVHCAWDNRLYGMLRHSFALGQKYITRLLAEITPIYPIR